MTILTYMSWEVAEWRGGIETRLLQMYLILWFWLWAYVNDVYNHFKSKPESQINLFFKNCNTEKN